MLQLALPTHPPAWLRRINPHLPLVMNSLILIAITTTLAQISWHLLPPLPLTMLPAAITPVVPPTPTSLQRQPNPHLFGQAATTKAKANTHKPVIKPGIAPPATTLNLKLSGIVAADNAAEARAIINHNGEDKTYRLNDALPSNATIISIQTHHVVLQRNGQSELLYLNPQDLTPNPPPQAQTKTTPPVADPQSTPIDLAKLGQHLNAEPAYQQEQLIGFKISPKNTPESSALLSRYQLVAGDIITEVNGIALNTINAGMTAIKQLSSNSSQPVQVSLLRDQTPLALTIDLNAPAP